jgi:hypothetical protein
MATSSMSGFAPKCYVVMEVGNTRQIHEISVERMEVSHEFHGIDSITINGRHLQMQSTDGQIDPHLDDPKLEHRIKIIEQALHAKRH